VAQATREAEAAFGDGGVYLERFVEHARHIEVQVLGDGRDAVHFFERDCSLQRRRQKLWEEAPAAVLDDDIRTRLTASAVALAEHVGYKGAGTVEYLYDPATREFFFIEMNTRIQVEHPITEEICGVDLITAMLRIARGEPLPSSQEGIQRRGHAIEVRINAEDASRDFLPSPGRVDAVTWPQGPGVRVDTMVRAGSSIPPYYDSLIGKLIVWGADRGEALARLGRALSEVRIEGPATTVDYLRDLLAHADLQRNDVHTTWLESRPTGQGA
jgi:acetyl-CoA carboxylase, biotin carboxylase subunit